MHPDTRTPHTRRVSEPFLPSTRVPAHPSTQRGKRKGAGGVPDAAADRNRKGAGGKQAGADATAGEEELAFPKPKETHTTLNHRHHPQHKQQNPQEPPRKTHNSKHTIASSSTSTSTSSSTPSPACWPHIITSLLHSLPTSISTPTSFTAPCLTHLQLNPPAAV